MNVLEQRQAEAVVSIAKTLRTPDWEQRRYEIAKDIFVHRMMLPQERRSLTEEGDAEIAVDLAGAMFTTMMSWWRLTRKRWRKVVAT